jgi:flagellar hook-length control protein FliK
MTTTSVNDVSTMLNALTTSVSAKVSSQTSGASFQSVLDSRTGNNDTGADNKAAVKTDKGNSTAGSTAISKNDTSRRDSLNAKAADKSDEKSEISDDEDLNGDDKIADNTEAVIDTLMTAAMQIADTITETFDITHEELQDIMDDMGIDTVGLLDTQILQEVMLEAGGAGDSLELLTDENLYNNFNEVMNSLDTVLESDSGIASMTVEELKDAFDMAETATVDNIPEIIETDVTPQTNVLQNDRQQDNTVRESDVTVDSQAADDTDVSGSSIMLERSEQSKENSEEPSKNSEDKHSDDNGRFTGSFVQNLQDNNVTAVQGTETESMSGSEVNTRDIMEQIMDYMKVQVKADTSNLEMQLHPASLGTLRIQLASNGGTVTANFITQNETVKAALESQMVQLKENFAEQGIKVEAIEVTVQTHQFEQNLEQNQGHGTSDSEPRSRGTRRIRLEGGILSDDELEELDEDDRLAAEMMAANGGTVDYTA